MADETIKRTHTYHAEATSLHGNLFLPLKQEVPPQSYLKLHEDGGYLSQDSDRYRLEGIYSFAAAYTQVTGHEVEEHKGRGWATLSTSVVEKLNILDVVTADRVVAQISTTHPLNGYVPSITLLGSRFENLKIAGHRVNLTIDPYIFGQAPVDDDYIRRDQKMMKVISDLDEPEHHRHDMAEDLPESYPCCEEDLEVGSPDRATTMRCSLVKDSSFFEPHKSGYPGQPAKHVIDVPHFGKVYLATIRIDHSKFHQQTGVPKQTTVQLTMIKVKMGCIASGQGSVATARTNGISHP